MLGKIYDQGSLAVVYSPIIKTSNSGMFTNKRLAILSIYQEVLGYQSKLPDSFETFQDIKCVRHCKESVNIKQQNTFTYCISSLDQTILILKWQQKIWEFKFQNTEISKQWYRFIFEILNPLIIKPQSPQKQEQNKNLNFSKLKSVSRFSNLSPQQNQNTNPIEFILLNQKNDTNKQLFAPRQNPQVNTHKESKPQYRFKQFERENRLGYESFKPSAPIITTFRERFPNNTMFKSVRKESATSSELESAQNWNMLWFEAIEGQQEHVRIDIYNSFLKTCQNVCKEIHKQLTMLKHYRHYVPAKISAYEQIYNYKHVTYHLLLQKDIQSSEAELCSDVLLQQYKKLQENYTLILRATKNKGLIKIPLSCIFSYRGFNYFCEADIPSNFIQVDHSDKFIFHPQLQRLEQQIKLRINLSHANLYTNKLASIVQSQINVRKNHFLIIKDIKKLLPEINLNGYSSFILSKDYFLQSNVIYPKDYDYREQKAKCIFKFLKDQNSTCDIISYQDLKESLQKSCLNYSSFSDLIPLCYNKYLSKLFITEYVSQIFCHIVRNEMMIFVKKWNKDIDTMLKDEIPDYQSYIFQLLTQFLSEDISSNTRIWNIITNQIFQRLEIAVKMEDLILGYLLSSISLKIGIHLDYQLLILQKDHFFSQEILISPQALKSFEPLFIKFSDEDMCQSYEAMMIQIQNHEDQITVVNIQRFYRLKQQNLQHSIEPYNWKKICKVFSYYVPYDQQQQYSYLSIYSCLNFLYFDYNGFCILVSAIKWLFHSNRVDDALQLVHVFIDVSWFWVSHGNPFLINLYQIVGEYFRITGNLPSSIEYLSRCNQQFQKLVKGNVQLDNLGRNEKLAQIYMSCNRHKKSLKKYLEVKKVLRKTDKDASRILNILVQISKLYLHLGDIQNCSKTCKQTLQFSTFNPFQRQQQQFEIYSTLLRSLQIKEDFSKYKFYVDVIQQKFKNSKNPLILQKILRLSLQQILQKYNSYHLKKFAFVLYHFQRLVLPTEEELSLLQLFRRLIKQIGAQQPCKILRDCMEKHLEISDMIVQRQISAEDMLHNQGIMKIQNLLSLYCRFIGFQFILAHIVSNLKKQ